ncbi:MAG TPA: glutamine--tRNA ligase/YqeY domain fusion protein [Candidatus Limnocylindrales bacterium]|nr:glutamine--tRNA ligase/YqeY domain fusion protein [Candidatus Limnocylindrales bacterium]
MGNETTASSSSNDTARAPGLDFIRQRVADDVAAGRNQGRVVTRFPPEPNGYLHIGHAKSICLNFGVAIENGGRCHLRMDDTNPSKEDLEYVDSITEDVRWLGFDWGTHFYHAADYFDRLYEFAEELVRGGKAFVCDLSPEEMRQYRGTFTEPGKESPWRGRSVDENLDLFRRMRAGEFPNGTHTLRARIDMASPNIVMRDPVLYRIQHSDHHRTGDKWCIYPMYDFAHCLSDALEGITHSICTLEFVPNRALYDWVLDQVDLSSLPGRPQQIEFARLNLAYTVMSKRILRGLVEQNHVSGWDDPRMPTISGMRRRGYSAAGLRAFCESVGVAKADNMVAFAQLEHHVRDDLNRTSPRVMAVVDPIRVTIENWPAGQVEMIEAVNNPEDAAAGTRQVPFSGELFLERDDFMEDPPKKFFRLAPGREVRLRYAYFVTCTGVEKDSAGKVTGLRCTYDPASRGGNSPDGRKVKATLHWVSAAHAIPAEVRLYNLLFTRENPLKVADGESPFDSLNPASLEIVRDARVEPSLAAAKAGERYQFERLGYFCIDPDSRGGALVVNRTATLKDEWANIQKRQD